MCCVESTGTAQLVEGLLAQLLGSPLLVHAEFMANDVVEKLELSVHLGILDSVYVPFGKYTGRAVRQAASKALWIAADWSSQLSTFAP